MPERAQLKEFEKCLQSLIQTLPSRTVLAQLSPTQLRSIRRHVETAIKHLESLAKDIDPVGQPPLIFDPANPKVIGELIARTLLLQPPYPLKEVGRFYGSGVYALYYRGEFHAYTPLRGKAHPIYVGKADPQNLHAHTAKDQGTGLSNRLRDHRRSIAAAENLDLADFDCRYLVVKSAWQETAEDFLISVFKPIWNSELGICYGFGKHGDSATTRANRRSPWDTLHPGRKWATTSDNVPNVKSVQQILAEIKQHFAANPPKRNVALVK